MIPDAWNADPATGPDRSRAWSGFFLFFAAAALTGAAKHGIPHYLTGLGVYLVVFASSVATGLGILHAEAATVGARVRAPSHRRWLRRGAVGKFALYSVAVALNESFLIVILNTALGLIPVMVAELGATRGGGQRSGRVGGGGWVAGGLAFSSTAAFVYILGVPSHPWFDHRDLAHVLMAVALLIIYQGVRPSSAFSPAPRPAVGKA